MKKFLIGAVAALSLALVATDIADARGFGGGFGGGRSFGGGGFSRSFGGFGRSYSAPRPTYIYRPSPVFRSAPQTPRPTFTPRSSTYRPSPIFRSAPRTTFGGGGRGFGGGRSFTGGRGFGGRTVVIHHGYGYGGYGYASIMHPFHPLNPYNPMWMPMYPYYHPWYNPYYWSMWYGGPMYSPTPTNNDRYVMVPVAPGSKVMYMCDIDRSPTYCM